LQEWRASLREVRRTVAKEHLNQVKGKTRSQRIESALEALKELGGDATIQEGGGKLTIVVPVLKQVIENQAQGWAETANFIPVGLGELLQNFGAIICQFNINLAPVLESRFAGNEILFYGSINQTHCTMMSDM
jgi:hypothetical protein